jgi:hypothetical protein
MVVSKGPLTHTITGGALGGKPNGACAPAIVDRGLITRSSVTPGNPGTPCTRSSMLNPAFTGVNSENPDSSPASSRPMAPRRAPFADVLVTPIQITLTPVLKIEMGRSAGLAVGL